MVPLWASVFVTTTFTAPAAWAGVLAVIEVPFTTVMLVADVPPTFTVAPDKNPVPMMVTVVPPLVVPVLGVIEATLGAGLDPGVGGLVVDARPPPQLGNNSSASSNRELRGK
jgi:hypothetical protein